MADERCADCIYFAELSHNFQLGNGFEESNCCVHFVVTEKTAWVTEVTPNDRCEMFFRRDSDVR